MSKATRDNFDLYGVKSIMETNLVALLLVCMCQVLLQRNSSSCTRTGKRIKKKTGEKELEK